MNARQFLQSSGGLSYLAATVRRQRGHKTVGNAFFLQLPPQDWLGAGPNPGTADAKARAATRAARPGALSKAAGEEVGEGAALMAEDVRMRSRLRDAVWMAPQEQAAAEAAAAFSKPRAWKVRRNCRPLSWVRVAASPVVYF